MTVQFAVLEAALHLLVRGMMGWRNKAARVVTDPMRFGELVDLAQALVKSGIPADRSRRERIRKLLRRLKAVAKERNAVTHAAIVPFKDEAKLVRVRDAGALGLPPGPPLTDVSKVKEVAVSCDELAREVAQLYWEFRREAEA